MIYDPSDDSYLMQDVLKKYLKNRNKNIKILDMGSGSGIQIETCKDLGFNDLLAVDLDGEVVEYLKGKSLNVVRSDLFLKIKNYRFDLIIFNPPYLPEDEREDKESSRITSAGKEGYEFINRFLKEAKSHLNENGRILLLFSSLSKPKKILGFAKDLGYEYNFMESKKIPFEELYVYEFFRE